MNRLIALIVVIGIAGSGCQSDAPPGADGNGSESARWAVHFNDPLAGSPDPDGPSAQGGSMVSSLIDAVDDAEATLDIAVYHLRADVAIEALDRACGRGVEVRLIVEDDESRPTTLPDCVQLTLDRNRRLMHHKFAILDDSRVWVGSANWTSTSFYDDANNALVIEHAAVVDAFEAEFGQMIGAGNYGPDKRDVHPERFSVNGQSTEVRFGPTDNPRDRLVELIDNAGKSLRIAMNTLTDDPLSKAIRQARERGVEVEALWDFQDWDLCQFSEAEEFVAAGLGAWDALPGLLHHKFAVIDGETVVTGSANWSASGMERNDETVLIIHSRLIAEQYASEFQDLRADARSYSDSATTPPRVELRHFQSVRSGALVQWRPRPMDAVERYEVCRLSRPEASECEATIERPGWAWYAVDRTVNPGETVWYRVRGFDGEMWSAYSNVYRATVPDDVPVMSAEEAKRKLDEFQGKTVSVRFRAVNEPRQIGENGHVFLNATENYEADFTAFLPGCTMPRFNGSGLDLFGLQGERVEVTGELESYDGGPEIVVTGPWQVRVLGD